MFFAPGQRRHYAFDVRESEAVTYRVRGSVSNSYSAPYTIVVAP